MSASVPSGGARLPAVAGLSLLFTGLFFFEYLEPFKRAYIPFDLPGFHYPLANYAFLALREGRLPLWDPTIYSGMSFAGNIQAGLFYPPNWVLWAACARLERLPSEGLEYLVLAHFWLAFLLAWAWLRRKHATLPSLLGAGVYAYSGYMLLQMQHQGLIGAYTWMPLGLWGIDQAAETRRWAPLWKLAAASALSFLAGYPPTWVAFCVCVAAYAVAGPARWRTALGTCLALALSVLLVMIQLLPALEAASLKIPETKYGEGVRRAGAFVSYLIPNYFDFERREGTVTRRVGEYLYLGAPALFGLIWLIARRGRLGQTPALAMAVATLVAVTNPFDLVWTVVQHSTWLSQVARDWYFLAGLTLAAAALTAAALDDFLRKRAAAPVPTWLCWVAVSLLAGWSARQLWIWPPGGPVFSSGWRGAFEPAVMLVLFSLALWLWRDERGARRVVLGAALLLAVGVDYKVFGTSRLFNSEPGDKDRLSGAELLPGLDSQVLREMRAHSEYRVAVDSTGPQPEEFRHLGLTTPQGFDPLLPVQYKQVVEPAARFSEARQFTIDPGREEMLRLLAVRYIISTELPRGPAYDSLLANPNFRVLQPATSYYKVFEYTRAQLPYRWEIEQNMDPRTIQRLRWDPEHRSFLVRSQTGGRFVLVEQHYPGWRVRVDGLPAALERWKGAFQAVEVGPGEHRIDFEFRPLRLRVGAGLSLIGLIGLCWMARRGRSS